MKKSFVIILITILLTVAGLSWWKNGLTPVNQSDKSQKIFVVRKGEGVRAIAKELKEQNLIRDQIVFFLLVRQLNLDGKIQAGDFRLSPSMNAEEIAQALTVGMLDIWITVPEGKRAEEIANILKDKIPSYKDSWRNSLLKNEGYLFPDTYLIPKDGDINLIVSVMRNNFDKKFSGITNIESSKLSKKEIVIVASLIEREAKLPKDRPMVASVILNRLEISMPLQIDATIQYALGYQVFEKTWWKKNLTLEDLKIDSLYNTYTNTGLPPTPISNPGLEVLRAVINPAETNYLYYISDSSGQNHYAKTLQEHNANIKKFGL